MSRTSVPSVTRDSSSLLLLGTAANIISAEMSHAK